MKVFPLLLDLLWSPVGMKSLLLASSILFESIQLCQQSFPIDGTSATHMSIISVASKNIISRSISSGFTFTPKIINSKINQH
jgi:hypothetical protein